MRKDDIMARLRKLKALADLGVGGEADNAAALLDRIARENGIDLARIDDIVESERVVRVGTDEWKQRLFCHIVWRRYRDKEMFATYDPPNLSRFVGGKRRPFNAVRFWCADDFFVEVVAAFEILRRDYERQLRAFFRAFLTANDLLLQPRADEPERELSAADRRRILDAERLALGIERSELRKQITD